MIPPIARRFVAGETPAEVLDHARRLQGHDVGVICNRLGEHYTTPEPVADDREAYVALLDDIATTDLDACISVKPSQIGLDVSESLFRETLATIVERAATHDGFVWLDMEDHATTDATLDAFVHHANAHEWGAGGMGVCVQANLRRTPEDLRRLADLPGKVRLVKGAYDEPAPIAYRNSSRVNRAYEACLDVMFERFAGGIAVGSHDPAMIEHAIRRHEEHGTGFEIQMLMGVREEALYEFAEEYPVYQYVPYATSLHAQIEYIRRRWREALKILAYEANNLVRD